MLACFVVTFEADKLVLSILYSALSFSQLDLEFSSLEWNLLPILRTSKTKYSNKID